MVRPTAPAAKRRKPADKAESFLLRPITAFWVFLVATLSAAFCSPIQDCDEIFNYWEPSHYLNHGYGLQTWEYSPVYAIRSWTYAALHSFIILPVQLLGNKTVEFYYLRIVFALVCAGCQTQLFSVLSGTMNPRVGITFLVISVTSAGMFHASTAYLPSTFAMYTTMLGTAAFMDWRGGMRTAQGIMWFGIGATLGWPFAAALVLPFIAEETFVASITGQPFETLTRFLDGSVRSLIVLIVQSAIDTFFYRKLVIVPLNIVLYNVFGGAGKGPNIYGTEPWHYYVRNLTLNFNVWFPLALASMPLVLLQYTFGGRAPTRQTILRTITVLTPFYLWLAIFTLQPHKEERFMYPMYPLLALNAAISVHVILGFIGNSKPSSLAGKVPVQFRLLAIAIIGLVAVALGVLRTAGMITAYGAPLEVYKPLREPGFTRPGDTVCLGKEWYRFPSSYQLPIGVKAKFIRSDFKGLLPGEFSEAKTGFGFFPGAWLQPLGMNDENREDPAKYTDIAHCTFLVDSHFPHATNSDLEPAYVADPGRWEIITCKPFLDTAQTGIIGRILWVPTHRRVPERLRRKWGEYCLLKNRNAP